MQRKSDRNKVTFTICIVSFRLVKMAISTNQKPTVYRNMYENTGPGGGRPQIEVRTSFEVYTSIKVYCTSI